MKAHNIQIMFIRVRHEDIWMIPFTAMAIILAGYAATAHKASLWLVSGLLIAGMLIFSGVLIARKYSKKRSMLHVIMGVGLVIAAAVVSIIIKQIA